jgi:ABC-type transport system involved in cytochrome bd biosynthesis fused ATPase/permease subunit
LYFFLYLLYIHFFAPGLLYQRFIDSKSKCCCPDISELCRGKTLIVIVYRLNTIRRADEILAVADGKIAESGTHETLLRKDGIYRSFVTARESTRGWSRKSTA